MSIQFGRWDFDGRQIDTKYLTEAAGLLSPYGPDGRASYTANGINLLYFAFHTTKESRRETQPHVTRSGDVIMWDGLLDNRGELAKELGLADSEDCTDVFMVAAAWERWNTRSFARLLGDWALTIWSPSEQTLFLAKDFMGIRPLFYRAGDDNVVWSTVLDPLIVLAGSFFHLDQEYVAGWLSNFPAAHLTPYIGVHAVPPASYLEIRKGKIKTTKYWDFRSSHRIYHLTDRDYEEHFLTLLEQSVLRRLRSDAPILAELSGGVDSSSIVCIADRLRRSDRAPETRLDTVSYYDEGEPNWDERPYVAVVEEMRGRTGCHIDVSTHTLLNYQYDPSFPELTPIARNANSESVQQLNRCIASNGTRVLLSGFAGDEILGGVPNFIPQLADLVVAARFVALTKKLKAWALSQRTTVFVLLAETLRSLSPSSTSTYGNAEPIPWLEAQFISKHKALFSQHRRTSVFSVNPSFQEKLETIDALRRQIACSAQSVPSRCEKRYPYLDRDLVEFLFAVPLNQLQRPGQRRSLMRRALAGIVPSDLLNRKRKAFIAREPLLDISSHWPAYREFAEKSILGALGVIDPGRLLESLQQGKAGNMIPLPLLARTIVLEKWLRHINVHKKSP